MHAPFPRPPLLGALLSILAMLSLAGCATYEHTKGQVQMKMDKPDEGVTSLERAARLAPRDPEYQIDYLRGRESTVQQVLREAQALRDGGALPEAKAAYERALRMDPGNARAREALAAWGEDVRDGQRLQDGEAIIAAGKLEGALARAAGVLERQPGNARARKLQQSALDAKVKRDAQPSTGARKVLDTMVTLQFSNAPLRTVMDALSRSTGLNVLMDREVKTGLQVTIFVKDIAVLDALDFILMQSQLERRILNANTLIVFPSTEAKKAEYEELTIRTFQITNADIKYLNSMLKTMLKLREVSADERSGTLVIRDTPEKINLAAQLIAVHDVPDPEVMLEVELLELSNTRNSNLGLLPPSSITFSTPPGGASGGQAAGAGGSLTFGALRALRSPGLLTSPLSATLNFKLEDIDAQLLAAPRIRARNREKAKIMIGDRVPTITNTVTPLTTGSSVVTGNVSYQDVGLKLEFEPQVYADDQVGIKVALEVSNIAAQFTDAQGGRSYQIGTRNATTNLRLRDGETQILGGLISDDDRNTASKIPGLGHLPWVGRLFGNNEGTTIKSEIVLAITPHIVRNLRAPSPEARSIYSGTLNALRDRPIVAQPLEQLKFVPAGGAAATPGPAAAAYSPPAAEGAVSSPTAGTGERPESVPPSAPGTSLPPPPALIPRAAASRPK